MAFIDILIAAWEGLKDLISDFYCDNKQIYPSGIYCYKEQGYSLSRSPQCMALSRAVMDEKSLSPLFAVGGGAVARNDWCIIL